MGLRELVYTHIHGSNYSHDSYTSTHQFNLPQTHVTFQMDAPTPLYAAIYTPSTPTPTPTAHAHHAANATPCNVHREDQRTGSFTICSLLSPLSPSCLTYLFFLFSFLSFTHFPLIYIFSHPSSLSLILFPLSPLSCHFIISCLPFLLALSYPCLSVCLCLSPLSHPPFSSHHLQKVSIQ